jgi:hypothetical protein
VSRLGRISLVVVGAVAALAVVAALVVPRVVDADSLRPQAEERLSSILGRPVALGELRMSLWSGFGVRADGVRIGAPPGADPDSAVTLESRAVRVRAAILPLLRRQILIRSFHLEDGTLRVGPRVVARRTDWTGRLEGSLGGGMRSSGRIEGAVPALTGEPEATVAYEVTWAGGRLVIDRCAARLGAAALDATGELAGIRSAAPALWLRGAVSAGKTRCEGVVDVSLRSGAPELRFDLSSPFLDFDELLALLGGSSAVGRSGAAASFLLPAAVAAETAAGGSRWILEGGGEGTLRAAQSRIVGLSLANLVARAELRQGTLRLVEASFDTAGGRHRGEISARLEEADLPFALRSRLEGVRVEDLAAAVAPGHAATLQGMGALDADLEGRAPGGKPDRRSLAGTVRLDIVDGRLASIGVLRQVARILEKAGGKGVGEDATPFRSMAATFRVADGTARTDDLAMRSDDLDLDGMGSVGLDGLLDLDLLVSFSPPVSAAMAERNPKLRFRVGKDGRLSVPLRIIGTLVAPEVRIDVDRVLSEGVERILEEKGKKHFLKKLFGGR